jgi:hypothetical protein
MPSTSAEKPEFVPIASYVAFAFIGAVMLVGLVARCLASNNSTIRGANSLDLMIYQAAPKPAPVPKPRRSSIEQQFDDLTTPREDPINLARVQRGPRNF